jgi:choline-sulfatase
MLHHGRWAYHHYVGHAPELFDLQADPLQRHDLAADAAHAPVLARMEARLRQRLDPQAVDVRAKRDQAALVARFGGRERALGIGPVGASSVPQY